MSRDAYVGGARSPRGVRLPTVDRSPSRAYHPGGSPLGRAKRQSRSGNNSPDHYAHYPYVDDLNSPMLEERGRSMAVGPHHRSRSATRPSNPMSVRYQSLDRTAIDHDREFLPIRDRRERSLERGLYFDDETYGGRSSPQPFLGELQHQNSDLQRELGNLKKELELTNQKLGSSMHSIKTFWSPELKKERALRKEESAKYSLINDQLKLLSSENQKQAMLVRQLEEELRMRMRGPSIEMQQQMEVLYQENEHLTREIAILRDTIKELELRIETQKQTLQARDESVKKLLEMLQNKGMGKEEERQMFQQMQAMAQKQLDEFRVEIQRRDQEILAMGAKMKTLEEQHQDYQRHIAVLKESLCAKEEHYNMLQADVEELRQRLEEKNRHIEKKQQQHQQERARAAAEVAEMREHMDIKDRKINVLQRKIELHEATKKLQSGPQKPDQDLSGQARQLEEQRRQLEEQRKVVEDQKKEVDMKRKQLQEKERELNEAEKHLKERKKQMDQLEASLQKAGGSAAAAGELNKKLAEAEKNLQKAQEEAQRSAAEMERLLQLVQMSQEEQNMKEKQIMELQQALKTAQAKLKSQQQVNAQLEEARKKEEVSSQVPSGDLEDELAQKRQHVLRLEAELSSFEEALKETRNEMLLLETKLEKKEEMFLNKDLATTEDMNMLKKELEEKNVIIAMLEEKLESTLLNPPQLQELDDLVEIVATKQNRIEELENALRDTVEISTEREIVLKEEESKRNKIMEKVSKLEQRLLSLQAAQALRCHSCRPVVKRMHKLELTLNKLKSRRKEQMQELAQMKREALESAISEKDAHLALLEMSGIRNSRQAEEMEKLKMDKIRLVEKLKQENELSVSMNEEESEEESVLNGEDEEEEEREKTKENNNESNEEEGKEESKDVT